MKTCAGEQFHHRKPRHAPAMAAARMHSSSAYAMYGMRRYCAMVSAPAIATSTSIPSETMVVVPAAKPSMPSVMFTALDMPATMSIATTTNSIRGRYTSESLIAQPPCSVRTHVACKGTLTTCCSARSTPGVSPFTYRNHPTIRPRPSWKISFSQPYSPCREPPGRDAAVSFSQSSIDPSAASQTSTTKPMMT